MLNRKVRKLGVEVLEDRRLLSVEPSAAALVDPPKQVILEVMLIEVMPDDLFEFGVVYTTDPLDETLTGFGVRMHFDSSQITLNSLNNVFAGATQQVTADTADADNDPNTDMLANLLWFDLTGNFPGLGTLPLTLFSPNFTANSNFTGTMINFTEGSTAAGWNFEAPSITVDLASQLPEISIDDVSLVEQDGGAQTLFDFTISLSEASDEVVTVNTSTSDGTATVADGDYSMGAGTVQFQPGETEKTITVVANGDDRPEPDETFFVDLSDAQGATIADNQGMATILNDDTQISVNDRSLVEGDTGVTEFDFTVSLSHPSAVQVTANFVTADDTAEDENGDGDYQSTSGGIAFAPGETQKTISVSVNGDTVFEPDETFFVNLVNIAGADVTGLQATGTIRNDDTVTELPDLTIDDVSQLEGNVGTSNVQFTLLLSEAAATPVVLEYSTSDGTAQDESGDGDYQSAAGSITFAIGEIVKTITVPITGDLRVEPNETFFLDLSNVVGANPLDARGMATILNDDTNVSIDDVTQTEGNAGTKQFDFTISLQQPSALPVLVNHETTDGTAQDQSGDGDYQSSSGMVNFLPGQTQKTVSVVVNGDVTVEPDETFFVDLTSATNAVIVDSRGRGTIQNDDTAALSIGDATLAEGNAGTTLFTFTVDLSAPSSTPVTVNYATTGDTAEDESGDGDYQSAADTLTFNPGQTQRSITVSVNGDVTVEPDETFTVDLSGAVGASIADGSGTGTILNDDAATITIGDVSLNEGNSGRTDFDFTVTLSNPSSTAVTVGYSTSNGTAQNEFGDGDYQSAARTLTFSPGQTQQTITIGVNGDVTVEPDETFTVNLAGASGATIADGTGTGTILNDDAATISIGDVSMAEGDAGTTAFGFTARLSAPSSTPVDVNFATADGTAQDQTGDGDYQSASGTFSFAPGQTSGTITVQINGDTTPEPDETLLVNLSSPLGASIADGQGEGTILNDDVEMGNTRPTDPADVELNPIEEDVPGASNPGTSVAQIVAASGSTDADGDPLGIAVIARDNTGGQWQYSTGGANFLPIGAVADTAALLLTGQHSVRFVPAADFNTLAGPAPELHFSVWDQTLGAAGTLFDTTTDGAFSTGHAAATIEVAAVNDAPMITAPASVSGSARVNIDIDGVSVDDVDLNEGTGEIEVTLTVQHGILTTDFSSPISNTQTLRGTLAEVNARLALLGYTPEMGFAGTDTIEIIADDLGNTGSPGPRMTSTTIEAVVTLDEEPPQTGGISGYVYVDVNNDGMRHLDINGDGTPDVFDDGIGGVIVDLTGTTETGMPIARRVLTGADGYYEFHYESRYYFPNGLFNINPLPPGRYTITQTQPAFFMDGRDTPGNGAALVGSGNDEFTIDLAAGQTAEEYNFGERGLLPQFVSKRQFLARPPHDGEPTNLDLRSGPVWFSFDEGFVGQFEMVASTIGDEHLDVHLTLYNEHLVPLAHSTSGSRSPSDICIIDFCLTILTETIRWTGDGSQPLLLEVSGTHFNVQIEFSQVMSAALPEGLVRETPTRSPAESAREPVGLSQLVGITAGQTSSGTQHTPPPDAPAILPVPVFSGASSSITPSLLDAAPLGSDRLLGGSGGRIAPHEVVPDSDDPWPQRRRPDRPPVAGGKDDDESSDDRALVPDTSDDQHDADSADKADADAADRAFEEELWWFWLK